MRPRRWHAWNTVIVGGTLAIAVVHVAPQAHGGEPAAEVPIGCALGISGPALQPATSLRAARDAAFVALAVEDGPTALRSELSWSGDSFREVSDERTSGVFAGARFAGVRARAGGRIDALVCRRDALDPTQPPDRAWRDAWPRPISPHPGCALGLAGRDLDPPTRLRSARQDALEMLARAFEVEVHHTLWLLGGASVQRDQHVSSTKAARQRAEALASRFDEATWLDQDGRGPLKQAGVLYVRLCPAQG